MFSLATLASCSSFCCSTFSRVVFKDSLTIWDTFNLRKQTDHLVRFHWLTHSMACSLFSQLSGTAHSTQNTGKNLAAIPCQIGFTKILAIPLNCLNMITIHLFNQNNHVTWQLLILSMFICAITQWRHSILAILVLLPSTEISIKLLEYQSKWMGKKCQWNYWIWDEGAPCMYVWSAYFCMLCAIWLCY